MNARFRLYNMPKEWFILQFKPNSHYRAVKNLNQQGFETFLPMYKTTSRKASRFINKTQPLFPGYMFITFKRDDTNWRMINNTYGVSRLITFNSVVKSIPTKVISDLMARCDLEGNLLPEKILTKGDQVEILKGPFANFIASVETYHSDQRIWLLLDLMGRKIKIQTSSNAVQPSV